MACVPIGALVLPPSPTICTTPPCKHQIVWNQEEKWTPCINNERYLLEQRSITIILELKNYGKYLTNPLIAWHSCLCMSPILNSIEEATSNNILAETSGGFAGKGKSVQEHWSSSKEEGSSIWIWEGSLVIVVGWGIKADDISMSYQLTDKEGGCASGLHWINLAQRKLSHLNKEQHKKKNNVQMNGT